jgi:four helix bundle protein
MNEESRDARYLERPEQFESEQWMVGLANDPAAPYRNVLVEKSFSFAVLVVNVHKNIIAEKRDFEVARQFVRSGTAIGALIREAQNAESRPDFIHKLGIAQKECDETCYWLELMKETEIVGADQFNELHPKSLELLRIIRSSIITSKNRMNQSKDSLK